MKVWNKILSGLALALLSAIMVIGAAALVYRSFDHRPGLLAQKVPLDGIETTFMTDSAGYRFSSFTLTDSLGRVARGRLRAPLDNAGPLPVILVLGGIGTGGRAAGIIPLEAPALLAALDYPEIPPGKPRLYEIPHRARQLDRAVLQAIGAGFMALDYLCAHPLADSTRVSVLGASFGAPFAIIAGALDSRVKAVVLLQASENMGELIDWNLRRKIPLPLIRRPLSWLLGSLTAPYEPGRYITDLAPRPVLLVNGREDERVPQELAEALGRKAGTPAEQVWLESGHLHPSQTALIDTLTVITTEWLKKHDLL